MRDEFLKHARILVVDDEPQNVRYLEDVLGWAGYQHVEGVTEPRRALTRFRQFDPDLVILDLLMPEMDGFQVIEELRTMVPEDVYLPILVLTSDISREARRRALGAGARDFLTKPMSPTEIRIRVGNLLETRFLSLRCRRQERLLRSLREDTGDPGGRGESELLERWGAVLDLQTGASEGHSRRVSEMAGQLALKLGVDEEDAEAIRQGALLHDLGAQPAPGTASNGDSRAVLADSKLAVRVFEDTAVAALRAARDIALHRDERWDGDGTGGLRGEAIPLAARIVAVAERLDALTQGRPQGASEQTALARIEEESGSRFDPRVVEALVAARARAPS